MQDLLFLLLCLRCALGAASPRFAASYGSHMVLQQAPRRAVVWGYHHGHGGVVLELDGEAVDVADGGEPNSWIAKLPPTAGGTEPHTLALWGGGAAGNATQRQVLDDVLFGDVWVCSGQSNMAFLLEHAFSGAALVNASSDHAEHLRMFTSFKTNAATPRAEATVEEPWSVSGPSAVSMNRRAQDLGGPLDDDWLYMSAVCYLFGVNIQKHTDTPVGLVNTNWGGTPIEFWSSGDALQRCQKNTRRQNSKSIRHAAAVATKDLGPSGGYNGMIRPFLNMTIFGAVWYQGESNSADSIDHVDPQGLPMARYGCRFPEMIADWRAKWHAGSHGETSPQFPFGYVQLASWVANGFGPSAIRWAQTAGFGSVPNKKMPNVFTAIGIDLTDRTSPYGSVHIRDKSSVAKRLAAGAIAVAYNSSTTYWQGPTVSSAVMRNRSAIVVTFGNVGPSGQLDVRNTSGMEVCTLGGTLNCSAESGKWVPVDIVLAAAAAAGNGNQVVLALPAPQHTQHNEDANRSLLLRYAWRALAWEYKSGGIYAEKGSDYVAAPFRVLVGQVPAGQLSASGQAGAGSGPATDVSASVDPVAAERQALVDLYNAAGGPAWRRSDNWLSEKSVCAWYGVVCFNTTDADKEGRIRQFSLYDNLLEGTIPSSLGALSLVDYFALSTNKLTGPIPNGLGATFTHTTYFDLRYNFLNGTLPLSLAKMTRVNHLVLADNKFTDSHNLATILSAMPLLSYLDVRSNRLADSLKAAAPLCALSNLTFCGLASAKYHTNVFSDVPDCLKSKCVL